MAEATDAAGRAIALQWASEPGDAYSSIAGAGDAASRLAAAALTPTTQATLVVSPGSLEPGGRYRFRVSAGWAGQPGGRGFAEATVQVSAGPSAGRLRVAPMAGQALRTNFTLSAEGWLAEDLPLRYAFGTARANCDGCPERSVGSRPAPVTALHDEPAAASDPNIRFAP